MKVFIFINFFILLALLQLAYGRTLKPTQGSNNLNGSRSEAADIELDLLESTETNTKSSYNSENTESTLSSTITPDHGSEQPGSLSLTKNWHMLYTPRLRPYASDQFPETYETPKIKLHESWPFLNSSPGVAPSITPVSITNTTTDSDGRRITTTVTIEPITWTRKTIQISPPNWLPSDAKTGSVPVWPAWREIGKEQHSASSPNLFELNKMPNVGNIEPKDRHPITTLNIDDMPITAFAKDHKSVDDAFEKALPEPTVKVKNIGFESNLTTDVQDILKKAGIDPHDSRHLNGEPVIRTRVEPDGRVITTTYKINTLPVDNGTPIDTDNLRYPTSFSDRSNELENSFTKTDEQRGSKGYLDTSLRTNVDDLLKQAGINPSELKNNQSVTKIQTRPDGSTITTTYRVRTFPINSEVESNWRSKYIPLKRDPPTIFHHGSFEENLKTPFVTAENFEPTPINKDIEILRPISNNHQRSSGPDVQDLLMKERISPNSIGNDEPVTRTRMEPDHSIVTATYRTRQSILPTQTDESYHHGYRHIPLGAHLIPSSSYPNYGITPSSTFDNKEFSFSNYPNMFNNDKNNNNIGANGVPPSAAPVSPFMPTASSTPLSVVTTSFRTFTPNSTTPAPVAAPNNNHSNNSNNDPIDAFLDRTKLNVNDELSEKGESERTIVTEDGRVLTVKLLLSSVKSDADKSDKKSNDAIESKPIK